MKALRYIGMTASLLVLTACAEPPPPRSVSSFIEHPHLLEAALIRCTQNRTENRYDAECTNAREAVRLLEKKDDEANQKELEAQSQRKRDALRRTQRAAAEARRRSAEAQRRREEAEYLAQFGELPPDAVMEPDSTTGNMPLAVIPEPEIDDSIMNSDVGPLPTIGSNAPTAEVAPLEDLPTDLDAIRDELRRRNDEDEQ
jgi:hypothetical protein